MNLIEGLQEEINRCRELLKEYESIGNVGIFGATMIKQEIKEAENMIAMGDTIGMMKYYEGLKCII